MFGYASAAAAKIGGHRQTLLLCFFMFLMTSGTAPSFAQTVALPEYSGASIAETAPFTLYANPRNGGAKHIAFGNAELVMQSDGNLAMYRQGDLLWSTSMFPWLSLDPGQPLTRERNCGDCYAMFQTDGNLVLYDPNDDNSPDHAYWSTTPNGKPGAMLQLSSLQPYVQIIGASRLPLWIGSPFYANAGSGAAHPTFNPWIDEPYVIGAWYLTAFSQAGDVPAFWSESALGRWDPWGGVRDGFKNPENVPFNGDRNFTPRQPAIGFYDQIGQPVMDEHIRQAANKGLSYFAFYWYWDADLQAESQNSTPIHRFVSSPYKGLMKFMIVPVRTSVQPTPPPTTLSSFESRLVPYIVDHYLADPSYLTSPDGRPIIGDWDFGLEAADHAAGMQYLRNYTFAKLRKYPLILGMAENPPTTDDDGKMCFQMHMTPAQALNYSISRQSIDYGQMMSDWMPKFIEKPTRITIPCTTAGFDARPWCALQPDNCKPGKPYWYYNTGINPDAFKTHLATVKSYLDANPSTSLNALTVYAWNEWGEGGMIEPGKTWGPAYIDAIQSAFGLQPRTPNFVPVRLDAEFFTPANRDALFETYAYQSFLGRIPTPDELHSYEVTPLDKIQFINALIESPEYKLKWAPQLRSVINTTVLLAEQILNRNPTSAELKTWVPRVAQFGLDDFADFLLYSPEVAARDPVLAPATASADETRGLTQIYRLKMGVDYLYTGDTSEISAAVSEKGYMLDGPAWKVFRDPQPGMVALMRCYDGIVHFLSISPTCENQTMEGIVGYGYARELPGTSQLLRYRNAGGSPVELISTNKPEIRSITGQGFHLDQPLLYLPGQS